MSCGSPPAPCAACFGVREALSAEPPDSFPQSTFQTSPFLAFITPSSSLGCGTARYSRGQVLLPCLPSPQWWMLVGCWAGPPFPVPLPGIPSSMAVPTLLFHETLPCIASCTFCKVTSSEMLPNHHGTECAGYQEPGEDSGGCRSDEDAQELLWTIWKKRGEKAPKPSPGCSSLHPCRPFLREVAPLVLKG